MARPTGSQAIFSRGMSFGRALYEEFRASNVPFMAGSIAYSAFISLFPLLVLAVVVASIVGGDAFSQYVLSATERFLSPSGQELVVESLDSAIGRSELSVLSALVFLWATLRVFRGLDIAFSILYGTEDVQGLFNQLKDGLVVLFALGVAAAGSFVLYLVLDRIPSVPFGEVLTPVVVVLFLTIALLPVYYVFPDTDLTVRQVVPGAFVAAIGWTILQIGFRLYVALSDKTELYGVIGGVILLITWLYFGALILLLGGTVNVVLDSRITDVAETT